MTVDRHTTGDMQPYIYRTDDYGQTWTADRRARRGRAGLCARDQGGPGQPDLLFPGTEFGLWISIDGGERWAQFKRGNFPAVAVRDIVVQPRDQDLVLATHGRGIWIVDDITPSATPGWGRSGAEAAFLPGRPVQQRIQGSGGWPTGDASFNGGNPAGGAVITYYQHKRHMFGRIKPPGAGCAGAVVDTIPASARRGINRVTWSMRVKPPELPPAAQVAQAGFTGRACCPVLYTVRLTKGDKTFETTLPVALDRRATFTEGDRKAQNDAAMRVHALFGSMTALVGASTPFVRPRIGNWGRRCRRPTQPSAGGGDGDEGGWRTRAPSDARGGAITGEERLRGEHANELYNAILSFKAVPPTTRWSASTC